MAGFVGTLLVVQLGLAIQDGEHAIRYSLAQVERFMRRVANQEAFAKNVNDMASEGER
jgi:hypothetical protein